MNVPDFWNDTNSNDEVKFVPPAKPAPQQRPMPMVMPQRQVKPAWFWLACVSIPTVGAVALGAIVMTSLNGEGAAVRTMAESNAMLAAKTAETRPVNVCILANKCPGSGQAEPAQPAPVPMPEQYGASVGYQIPKPAPSRWGLYPLEVVQESYRFCQASNWVGEWPDQGVTCQGLSSDLFHGYLDSVAVRGN